MALNVLPPRNERGRERDNAALIQGLQGFGENAVNSYGREKDRARQMQQEQASSQAFADMFGPEAGNLSPELKKEFLKYAMTGQNQKMAQELKGQKQEEAPSTTAQTSFDGLATLLKKGNLGRGSGIAGFFGGKTAQDTGEFNSLTGGLEAELVDMVSRGTLSNARFKYITETLLPKPTDTQDEIKGKLIGLSQLLGLDDSALTGQKSSVGGKRTIASFGE